MTEGPTDREYLLALLQERDRATTVAAEEREKAALALRTTLETLMSEGQDRLREHIENQIESVRAALESGERLEISRIKNVNDALIAHVARQVESVALSAKAASDRSDALELQLTARIDSVRGELQLTHEASQKAIEKAEAGSEKRFASVNEFRAQLADQSATFMPREVAEAKLEELRKMITVNTDRLNLTGGEARGRSISRESIYATVTIVVAVSAILATIAINSLR